MSIFTHVRKQPVHDLGHIALVAVQELIKSKIDNKDSHVHLLDGNGDNYIDIEDFIIERGGSIDGNLHDLLKVNNLLLQYGG
jgi:hypothetical protein